jgi:hypothetical protein
MTARESVGGTGCEKSPLGDCVWLLVLLNLTVLAMWHGLHSGWTLSMVLVPPNASSIMWSTSDARSPQYMHVLPQTRKHAALSLRHSVVVPNLCALLIFHHHDFLVVI